MIDVLLATYKPNPVYLKAQVDSILAQKGVEVNLIRREDEKGEGACANFAALLMRSHSGYVAFADQDDVWDEDKLLRSISKMQELEGKYGKETPILVCGDTRVVDSELNLIDSSFASHSAIDSCRILPRQVVLQNIASGNTFLMNAALRHKASPIPKSAAMHDHWVMLVASVFGKIAYLKEPTLCYRQHNNNVLGAAKFGVRYYWNRYKQGRDALRERFYANITQSETFVERFGDKSPICIKAICGLKSKSKISRIYTVFKYRIFKSGLIRNLGMLAII